MLEKVVVINGLTRWGGEFKDKVTGEIVRGTPYTKVFFLSDELVASENKKGLFESSYKGDYELFHKINGRFPIECKVIFNLKNGAKGAEIWVTDIIPIPVPKL